MTRCAFHARAAGLDVHVVTVTCWNWFAFAGDVAAQDGAIGRFVSIGTARAERADPAGSVPTRSPRAEFDPHIRPLRRELDLGRPVAPPEIGCALRERTRGLQLQKRLWEIPTVAARSCPPSGRKSFVGFGDASAAIRCACSSVPPFAEIRRDPGRPKRVVAGRRRQPRGHRAPLDHGQDETPPAGRALARRRRRVRFCGATWAPRSEVPLGRATPRPEIRLKNRRVARPGRHREHRVGLTRACCSRSLAPTADGR